MSNFHLVRMVTEDGYEIKDIVQIIQYMDGWVLLTKNGSIFTNVKQLFKKDDDN